MSTPLSAGSAAVVALGLFVVFAALGFGWRSWVQHRATGSTGFRGLGGRPGSVEWCAGLGFGAALLAAIAGPLLQLLGVVTPWALITAPWLQAVGLALALLGIAGTVYAQRDMGESWRIGVDHSETTVLVRSGVFGMVRNPIYSAMLLFAAGIALVTPNWVAVAGLLLLFGSVEAQVRAVEEPYLAGVHGEPYRAYLATVGRFVPALGVSR